MHARGRVRTRDNIALIVQFYFIIPLTSPPYAADLSRVSQIKETLPVDRRDDEKEEKKQKRKKKLK